MTTLELGIICATVLGVAAIALVGALAVRATPSAVTEHPPAVVRSTVAVHTLDGVTLRGVVTACTERLLVLAEARVVRGTSESALEGVLRVPASNVAFVQQISGPPEDA